MLVSRQFNLIHSNLNLNLNQSFISHSSSKPNNLPSKFHLRLRTLNSIKENKSLIIINKPQQQEDNFWGAVTLIIGTAVGPGMLGLPCATIKAGPIPSTIAILLSWLYVVSSILLVAELTFLSMEQHGLQEVSFTALATTAFGRRMGTFVALVYACLSFALIVACVSGIGSIISQWFPFIRATILTHALFPSFVWGIIGFSPFTVIDSANRLLCFLMLFSITALVGIGVSVGRANLLTSFAYASWAPSSILPAIPITVLTLGFHVITPFVCKIVGKTAFDARKAILLGGVVPLVMVLSWNLVVLGLAGSSAASLQNPIALLLSVNSSALPAVQGFAFAALATSLIGYAVSFPKQLMDTLQLVSKEFRSVERSSLATNCFGKVGFITFSRLNGGIGTPGHVSFHKLKLNSNSGAIRGISSTSSKSNHVIVMAVVLGAPILIASFFPATFSKALDFAGVYANCFLFGILPPAMAWIYRSKRNIRSQGSDGVKLLPGGNIALALLFIIAVTLAIWH
ncbi:hypothetical protein ACHQM5_012166 [Ranunculus cassubicifolius]